MNRNRLSSKKYLVFLVLGILVLSIVGFLIAMDSAKQPPFRGAEWLMQLTIENEDTFGEIRKNLRDIIIQGGIEGAIQVTEQALAQQEITMPQCHVLLHVLGHEAYFKYEQDFDRLASQESILCTQSFQHGVEGQIIGSSGGDRVKDLHAFCMELRKDSPGVTCYHGAGHELMRESYDIEYSLNGCDSLAGGPEQDLTDCYRGVFSEYANGALRYDGDSGLSLPGKPPITLNFERPYEICFKLAEIHQASCVSQLTKIFHETSVGLDDALQKCIEEMYEPWVQKICVRILSGMYAQIFLSEENMVLPTVSFSSLPNELQQAYIEGIAEAFRAFDLSNLEKDWKSWCESFEEKQDKDFCKSFFPLTGEDVGTLALIKNWPKQASAEEQKAYNAPIRILAMDAEYLDITNCKPDSLIFQVRYGESFSIQNRDSVVHEIRHFYWTKDPIAVAAENVQDIRVADLVDGPGGIYAYGCDRTGEASGVLVITQ